MMEKKPFKWEICTATFALKRFLTVHTASVHEGNKPLKCEICDKKFSRSHLKKHSVSVHENMKSLNIT